MSEIVERLQEFVEYAKTMKDEKGEAQLFCDRLFQAFGHKGLIEAGATLEFRLKKDAGKGGVSFADLMWKPRLLIEMKSAGAKLHLHYKQTLRQGAATGTVVRDWLSLHPSRHALKA